MYFTVSEAVNCLSKAVEIYTDMVRTFNPESASHDCSRRHLYILFHCFSEKIRLDVSSESSARQRIHVKNQALFFIKRKK